MTIQVEPKNWVIYTQISSFNMLKTIYLLTPPTFGNIPLLMAH